MTLLHVDIDRFKLVNDSMGHGVGDDLLVAVAERLSQRVRPGDLVGRLGGDEFVIVVAGLPDEDSALDFGERTRLMFKQAYNVRDTEITVTASVGIAHQPARVGVAEELIRDADTAVNHAKSRGGDDVVIFDTSMRERVAERLHLERELRTALARDELLLHFQPKLRLSDHKVVGLEALLRWQHPELGTVRPDKFIAIAEDTGMIVEIGAWVIEQACAELARLRAAFRGASDICMSVNVSARQLRSDTLMDTIAQALLRHRVPPEALCLELTESILMENLDLVSGQLDAIRECGTRISIDDFGTGYSSLAYLSKLSVDELKIDRSFVKELGEDQSAASLIQAVVFIASSLGITSVAEGVETPEQAQLVGDLGCTEVQGFLFARPLPPGELDIKLIELGLAPAKHLRAVPATAQQALGTTACGRPGRI
jgi:diguanylate cyclase (GGDEF)-like protein